MIEELTAAENFPGGVRGMALAENTRKAYRKGWACFAEYCRRAKIADPLTVSPDTVASFLISLTTQGSPKSGQVLSMGTVVLYASAITKQYISAGLPSPTHHPTVTATLKGLARRPGAGQAAASLRYRPLAETVRRADRAGPGSRVGTLPSGRIRYQCDGPPRPPGQDHGSHAASQSFFGYEIRPGRRLFQGPCGGNVPVRTISILPFGAFRANMPENAAMAGTPLVPVLFLKPAVPQALAIEVGVDALPDVVLEVDNTTDARRRRTGSPAERYSVMSRRCA